MPPPAPGDDRDLVLQSHGTPSRNRPVQGTAPHARVEASGCYRGQREVASIRSTSSAAVVRRRRSFGLSGSSIAAERRHPSVAAGEQQRSAGVAGGDPDDPSVGLVGQAVDEAVGDHPGDRAGSSSVASRPSTVASAPIVRGPPKTRTDRADNRGADTPVARSSWANRRSRWSAAEWKSGRQFVVGGCNMAHGRYISCST